MPAKPSLERPRRSSLSAKLGIFLFLHSIETCSTSIFMIFNEIFLKQYWFVVWNTYLCNSD